MRLQSHQDFATEMAAGTASFIRLAEAFPGTWGRTTTAKDQETFTKDLHIAMGYRPDQPEY